MNRTNRQWLLAKRPAGSITPEDFEYVEVDFPEPELKPGEILIKNQLFRCAPAMRTWMKATSQFAAPMPLGEPMRSIAAGEVIASENPDFPVGCTVSTRTGWQDYAVVDAASPETRIFKKPDDVSLIDFEGVYGANSVTAYFGLLKIGDPQPGETLVVSGAAGSTGAVAAQIGKIKGCRVIGIAGSDDKGRWLLDDCKIDAVINYKTENVEARLKELCPEGVNVFFDNVGGQILDAVIESMAPFGRVALCGQISSYDEGDTLATGPRNMMKVIYWRLKLQGFLAYDYRDELEQCLNDLREWHEDGRLITVEDIYQGFDTLPRTFLRLFDGTNFGTLLVMNDID